jgi:hypothetical protein
VDLEAQRRWGKIGGRTGGSISAERFKAASKKLRVAYAISPKLCIQCNSPIKFEMRTKSDCCSRSCAAFRLHGTRRGTPKHCIQCGVELQRLHRNGTYKTRKYCSNACRIKKEWEARKASYIDSGRVRNTPNQIRRFLIDTCGKVCAICGITEWTGKALPVVADHINGDPTDSRIANLRFVCPNCDALLPTFKGKNRGNGRAERRRRYSAGLSY